MDEEVAVRPGRVPPGVLPEVGPNVTTLAVFNIPWYCSMEEIVEEWPAGGRYDYLNILYNVEAQHNVGYGFINFTKNAYAVQFVERWHGRILAKQKRCKPLQTVPALKQGMLSNLAQLTREDLDQLAAVNMLPIVFLDGERLDAREASRRLGLTQAESPGLAVAQPSASSGDWPTGGFNQVRYDEPPQPDDVPMPNFAKNLVWMQF